MNCTSEDLAREGERCTDRAIGEEGSGWEILSALVSSFKEKKNKELVKC